jgi:arylformamidase
MKIIDLTHRIVSTMPVYPGTMSPGLKSISTIENEGFRETLLSMVTHTGTHIDLPSHIVKGGGFTDSFDVRHFYGQAIVIDISHFSGKTVPLTYIKQFEAGILKSEFVLFNANWSRFWNTNKYFASFPVLSAESASYLAESKIYGLGIDAISFDPVNSEDLPVHNILLGSGKVLVENLTNLDCLKNDRFYFSCFPLKIKDGDGSPVRAVAIYH